MDFNKFRKIAIDFVNDIDLVFPEYKIFDKELYKKLKDTSSDQEDDAIKELFDYCKGIYPKSFFDILYKNENIFEKEEYFLPEISFKNMWEADTSDDTKTKIWQYMQLILMTITEQMEDSSDFGDASQLFDLLDESDFKEKLADTFEELTKAFGNDLSGIDLSGIDLSGNVFSDNTEDISSNFNFMNESFNPEKIHEHLSKLLEGKIGSLAKEIAGDTMDELGLDMSGNTKNVFESLIKDPSKLMVLMKKIGDKIENKISKGEINKEELMTEASELFKNMKDMPGFEEMFNKMAKGHMGRKGGKVPSMNTMESMLENNMKASRQRKKMLERLQDKRTQSLTNDTMNVKMSDNNTEKTVVRHSDEEIYKSFVVDDTVKPTVNKKKKKKKK
tara:strand:- start:6532 stop:7698 length:1167 start_codon:yes stop_codon:yes gene_type:complete